MSRGYATFVLHTHLPYCRLAGRWPHGEEWLHEAMLECYLPLVRALRRAGHDCGGSLGVTINVTPILAEQLRDALVQENFRAYLRERIAGARSDVERFSATPGLRGVTAAFHRERYQATQSFFEDEIAGDVVGALAELEGAGHIEVATSAATHGYLPLLQDDDAVRFQIETGIASHVRNFGRAPRSFWLPECAYRPGLERFLEDAGLRVFFSETHLVTGGLARGKARGGMAGPYPESRYVPQRLAEGPARNGTTFRPYSVAQSHVSVIGRNERTGMQVWSAAHGYPGDPAYREFHKKDSATGLHYWRVTGAGVDLGEKAEYDSAIAREVALAHARHFAGVVQAEIDAYAEGAGERGIVLSAYDTELFGHWWLEGVDWLEAAIRNLAASPLVELVTAGDFVASHPPQEAIELPEGSWGAGGDHGTWLNSETAWTWPEIRLRQARARGLLGVSTPATRQLARELLLLQSSDWQFLMTTGQAHDYAVERFHSHMERFDQLADAIEGGDAAAGRLAAEIGELDNPFPAIDPCRFAPGQPTPVVRG